MMTAGQTVDGGVAGDAGNGASNTSDGATDAGAPTDPRIPCDVNAQADAQACPGPSAACCAGFCTDTATDPTNCGACGVACTAHQFCTGVQCTDAVIANVCANANATVVLDQYAADIEGGTAIGAALTANCTPPTNVVQRNEDAGGVTAPTTGRPITGPGNTFVSGGGSYGHIGIAYLDMMALTPLYPYVSGNEYDIMQRSTGAKIVSTTFDALTAQHDYFFVETVVEPISGTLSFSGIGMLAPGTLAAGYYIGANIMPNRANYPLAWYIFEWTDTNGNSIPDAADTFTMVASGM
jgi:hypothetical protein